MPFIFHLVLILSFWGNDHKPSQDNYKSFTPENYDLKKDVKSCSTISYNVIQNFGENKLGKKQSHKTILFDSNGFLTSSVNFKSDGAAFWSKERPKYDFANNKIILNTYNSKDV